MFEIFASLLTLEVLVAVLFGFLLGFIVKTIINIWGGGGSVPPVAPPAGELCFMRSVVLSPSEVTELCNSAANSGHKTLAAKLKSINRINSKLVVADMGTGYELREFQAIDSSKDEMENGGVVFPSGEYIVYDRRGNEAKRGRILV